MKKLLLLATLTVSLFAISGQELFETKCMSCHGIKVPVNKTEKQQLIAPPIGNILYHLAQDFSSPEKIKKHIVEFSLNPTKEKAICKSVKRFGLMPSQKGNVTEDELNKIADFLNQIIAFSKNSHSKKGCNSKTCSTKSQGKSCSDKYHH